MSPPTPRLRVRARLAALAALTAAVVVMAASPALAHASFVSGSPGPGVGMAQAPGAVILQFSEPTVLGPSRILIQDEGGTDVGQGDTRHVTGDESSLRRDLGILAPGVYTVRWTTLSPLDGHTLKGSYRFAIGATTVGAATVEAGPVSSEGPLGVAGRWIALAGLALWFGTVALAGRVRSAGVARIDTIRRLAPGLVIAGAGASLVSTALVSSGTIGALGQVALGNRAGVLRTAVVAIAVAGVLAGPRRTRLFAGLSGLALVAEAASGHAGASPWPVVATLVFAVHLAAVGIWITAVVAGALAGRRVRDVLAAVSRPAVVAAAAVAATGLGSAALELTSPAELASTAYGQVVWAKGVALLLMVGFGWQHARRRKRQEEPDRTVRGFVRAEAVVAIATLGIAAVLVSFPNPPREDAAADAATNPTSALEDLLDAGAVSVAGRSGPYVVGITVSPPRPGDVEVLVQILGTEPGDGLRDVSIDASGAGSDTTITFEPCGPGCFRGDGTLDAEGTWTLDLAGASNRAALATSVTVPLPAPDGTGTLAAAQDAMDDVTSAAVREELRVTEFGDPIVSEYRFSAPDEMEWLIPAQPGSGRYAFGDTGYVRNETDDGWRKYAWVGGAFSWPQGFYRSFLADPRAVRILGPDTIGDVDTTVLSFVQTSYPAWYRVWVDGAGRIRHIEMLTEGHFMDQSLSRFGEPMTIEPPEPVVASG